MLHQKNGVKPAETMVLHLLYKTILCLSHSSGRTTQSVSASVGCATFLHVAYNKWSMGFPTLTPTADSPTSSFSQTKVEEGRRRKGAGESFHRSDLWSVWLYAPATCSRKELKLAGVWKCPLCLLCLIGSKNVFNESWVCKIGVEQLKSGQDNG